MLCGTDNIQTEYGEYLGILCGMLSVPHNTATNLNNVMTIGRIC